MHLGPSLFIIASMCCIFECVGECMFLSHLMFKAFVWVWCGEEEIFTHENSSHFGRMSKMECARATTYIWTRKTHTKNLPYAIKCVKEFSAVALPMQCDLTHSTQLHVSLRRWKPFSFFYSGGYRCLFPLRLAHSPFCVLFSSNRKLLTTICIFISAAVHSSTFK